MLLTKFFTKGWGSPENLMRLFAFRKLVSNRNTCYNLVSKQHPITIMNEETWKDCKIVEGKFRSPLALHLPDIVPHQVQDAYFQMVLPLKWKSTKHKPICIHLAGTGDHFYWRRRNLMAKPLLKDDIGAIILENPFYGLRKPKDQLRSSLHNVSDIFVMGGCLILECLVLLHWCEKQGYGPLGVSGLSMGGHMASLAATNWPKPLVLVPCLSWSTASAVFTEGVMSDSIDWNLLQQQYSSNSLFYDRLANLVTVVDKCKIMNSYKSVETNDTDIQSNSAKDSVVLNQLLSTKQTNQTYSNIDDNLIKNVSEIKQSGLLSPKLASALSLPKYMKRNVPPSDLSVLKKPRDAVHFMRGVMDECTHLRNFSVPFDASLIIAVCAQADGYVPREGCSSLEEIWPGSTVRYLNAGHVSAYIWYRKFFRKCIVEAFEKAKEKCT
ncbi:uncharacterized protein CBL_14067 [Carabus blaptoides fortunei]